MCWRVESIAHRMRHGLMKWRNGGVVAGRGNPNVHGNKVATAPLFSARIKH
jgi:hypothetical protein